MLASSVSRHRRRLREGFAADVAAHDLVDLRDLRLEPRVAFVRVLGLVHTPDLSGGGVVHGPQRLHPLHDLPQRGEALAIEADVVLQVDVYLSGPGVAAGGREDEGAFLVGDFDGVVDDGHRPVLREHRVSGNSPLHDELGHDAVEAGAVVEVDLHQLVQLLCAERCEAASDVDDDVAKLPVDDDVGFVHYLKLVGDLHDGNRDGCDDRGVHLPFGEVLLQLLLLLLLELRALALRDFPDFARHRFNPFKLLLQHFDPLFPAGVRRRRAGGLRRQAGQRGAVRRRAAHHQRQLLLDHVLGQTLRPQLLAPLFIERPGVLILFGCRTRENDEHGQNGEP
ncbi:hypothetical protein DIPPA_01282 [Diplonema papillatum]|nr:hypothetical protein DIPPA_01282 [Diplonema papillatum]